MLSNDVVQQLADMPVFKANCKALASELHISQADAQQELLIELIEHRLTEWGEEKVVAAIDTEEPALGWRVHYACKDVARRKHHADRAEKELVEELGVENSYSGKSGLPTPDVEQRTVDLLDPVQQDVLRALDMAQSMFSNHQTQQWVQSLLTNGKQETMLAFHQTDRQFNNKLRNVAAYCNSHRNRSVSYQRQEQEQRNAKELAILDGWNVLMADEDTTDLDIALWIKLHRRYVEPIVDKSEIRFQGLVMNDFCRAPNKDKYFLANLLAHRFEQLKEVKNNEQR